MISTHLRMHLPARPLLRHDYTRAKSVADVDPADGTAPALPSVLTIGEVCALLKVSRWTIYQLIRSRQLATIKLGRRRVVPATAVVALIERLQAEEAF